MRRRLKSGVAAKMLGVAVAASGGSYAHAKTPRDGGHIELKLTQEAIKCKRVLELDKSIRYAGMCASDGTLVASEYKKEITPLIDETELEFAVKLSAIRAMERDVLSTKLGRPMYSIASYENVKRVSFSFF